MRHGQGFHNVAGHADPANYLSWDYEDAHLTDFGWQQVSNLSLPASHPYPWVASNKAASLHETFLVLLLHLQRVVRPCTHLSVIASILMAYVIAGCSSEAS